MDNTCDKIFEVLSEQLRWTQLCLCNNQSWIGVDHKRTPDVLKWRVGSYHKSSIRCKICSHCGKRFNFITCFMNVKHLKYTYTNTINLKAIFDKGEMRKLELAHYLIIEKKN